MLKPAGKSAAQRFSYEQQQEPPRENHFYMQTKYLELFSVRLLVSSAVLTDRFGS